MSKNKTKIGGVGAIAIVAVIVLVRLLGGPDLLPDDSSRDTPAPTRASAPDSSTPSTAVPSESTSGDERVERLFQDRTSDVMVTISGPVSRVLRDDNEGSRHQRFIIRLSSGRTVLIAHNIDLADRVPLSQGERVTVRGEYEWTEQGGVIHWTHHDPKGWREGGWIEHDGVRYE